MSTFPSRRSRKDETIEVQAAAWLAQRDDGLTSDDEREFAAWRAADPRHEAAVVRLERTWGALQRLRDFRPEARAHPDRDVLVPRRRSRSGWFPTLGVLAGAAAMAWALLVYLRAPDRPPPESPAPVVRTYFTAAEGFQKVELSDGSVLTINGGSELRVAYAPDERRVTLLRGEVHFTVAKSPSRPFRVEAGAMTVRAVGTSFNVRLHDSAAEVLVTEGRVEVDDTRAPEIEPGTTVDELARRLLAVLDAGHRIRIALDALPSEAAAAAVETLSPEVVRAELAWQDAWLVFSDTPLGAAIAQFNERNRLQIELADEALAAVPIGGTFRAENVDGFVRLLAASNNVIVDRPAPERIVLREKRN